MGSQKYNKTFLELHSKTTVDFNRHHFHRLTSEIFSVAAELTLLASPSVLGAQMICSLAKQNSSVYLYLILRNPQSFISLRISHKVQPGSLSEPDVT